MIVHLDADCFLYSYLEEQFSKQEQEIRDEFATHSIITVSNIAYSVEAIVAQPWAGKVQVYKH